MHDRMLVSVREACYLLGSISPRHLWDLTAPRGPIPAVRLGKRVLYDPADLQRFIEQAKQKAVHELTEGQVQATQGDGNG